MATLNTTNLMLVIKATNEAAKVLKSVEGHLQQIVEAAARAANDAMAQIADTAAPAMDGGRALWQPRRTRRCRQAVGAPRRRSTRRAWPRLCK